MQRRSLDWQIRDELAMWRGVLAAETNRLRLTLPEANCIADVLMGHAKVTTTLGVYTHLFNTDDHADAMAALGAMGTGMTPSYGDNVIQLHG